jgi:hypothetical protein
MIAEFGMRIAECGVKLYRETRPTVLCRGVIHHALCRMVEKIELNSEGRPFLDRS